MILIKGDKIITTRTITITVMILTILKIQANIGEL